MFYFMKKIEKENFDECLMQRQKGKTNGEFLSLELYFYNNSHVNHFFASETREEFQIWRHKLPDGKTVIEYHVKDYIN